MANPAFAFAYMPTQILKPRTLIIQNALFFVTDEIKIPLFFLNLVHTLGKFTAFTVTGLCFPDPFIFE